MRTYKRFDTWFMRRTLPTLLSCAIFLVFMVILYSAVMKASKAIFVGLIVLNLALIFCLKSLKVVLHMFALEKRWFFRRNSVNGWTRCSPVYEKSHEKYIWFWNDHRKRDANWIQIDTKQHVGCVHRYYKRYYNRKINSGFKPKSVEIPNGFEPAPRA